MKPQEIRIGNWVMGNKPYQWGLDDFADWYYDHNSHTYGDNVKPIPLTEEWLLKLGAEENEGCFIHDRFKLQHHDVYKFWYVFDVTLMAYITKVEFVHEWQNVYFALNGEELTVK